MIVECLLFELLKHFTRRRAEYVMNFVNLVKFVVTWKQREESKHLKVNAANSPVVHLMIIVAVC